MSAIVTAPGPVFALVVGYVLKRLGIPDHRLGGPAASEKFRLLGENLAFVTLPIIIVILF